MSNVRYIKCDICGNAIPDSDFDFESYGRRIFLKLLNHIDICSECMSKIKQLSIDAKSAEDCACECVKNNPYDDIKDKDLAIAYLEGVQTVLDKLSHHKLRSM